MSNQPIAWGMPRPDGAIIDCITPEEHAREPGQYTVPLYAAPQPKAEQPAEQEPVRNEFNRVINHAIEQGIEASVFLRCWQEGDWSGCAEFGFEPNMGAYTASQPKAEPWTPRELELIDGMIEVQLHHADQCDRIANRTMAEKQKGWDMERVALLRKIRDTAPPPKAEPVAYIGMIDEEHFTEVCRKAGGNSNTLLYAAPQPRRLTDEEKREMWTNATVNPCTHMHCYLRGIEDAEDAIWSKT